MVVATLNTLLVVALASLHQHGARAAASPSGGWRGTRWFAALSALYVEVFRNIPLLLQIFFWYFSAIALLPGVATACISAACC